MLEPWMVVLGSALSPAAEAIPAGEQPGEESELLYW
jgi:hypothetical protein